MEIPIDTVTNRSTFTSTDIQSKVEFRLIGYEDKQAPSEIACATRMGRWFDGLVD